jgi:hypothetical protein
VLLLLHLFLGSSSSQIIVYLYMYIYWPQFISLVSSCLCSGAEEQWLCVVGRCWCVNGG